MPKCLQKHKNDFKELYVTSKSWQAVKALQWHTQLNLGHVIYSPSSKSSFAQLITDIIELNAEKITIKGIGREQWFFMLALR